MTYEEEEGEREYWLQRQWELRNGKDFFHTSYRTENGIEVEYHYAGDHLMGKYEKKTGKLVKPIIP